MIRRLTKREQKIFILCVVLAVVYFIYNFLVKPARGKLAMLDQEIVAQNRRLAKNAAAMQRAHALETTIEFYEQKFKQSRSNEETISSILAEIEAVATQLHLQIANLTPKRVQEANLYKRFLVNLTMDGNFMDILQFVHILQSEPHFFDVEEVRFDKGMREQTASVKTNLVLGKTFIP